MDDSKITYYIKDSENQYIRQHSTYAGTYTGDKPLEVDIRIWNNYCGIEDVADFNNFNIVLSFLTVEDNALLPYITVILSGRRNEVLSPIIENQTAVFSSSEPLILKGTANTGSDNDLDNYIDVTISFQMAPDAYLKDHDLKSLVMDVVEL
jgi:hypothetical protein